jgi:hypothetical protein
MGVCIAKPWIPDDPYGKGKKVEDDSGLICGARCHNLQIVRSLHVAKLKLWPENPAMSLTDGPLG